MITNTLKVTKLYKGNIEYEVGLNAQTPMKHTKKCALKT